MKKLLLTAVILNFTSPAFCQEIEINAIFAGSSSEKFSSCLGYKLGYISYIKSKNRLGFSLSHCFNKTKYEYNEPPYYTSNVDPENQRIAFKIHYAFRLMDNPRTKIYFGPEIGLNYFVLNEQHHRIEIDGQGDAIERHFSSNYSTINLGIGLLLEFELNKVVNERISTYFSVHHETIISEEFLAMGAREWVVLWLNLNLGIRYKLNKEK